MILSYHSFNKLDYSSDLNEKIYIPTACDTTILLLKISPFGIDSFFLSINYRILSIFFPGNNLLKFKEQIV